MDNLNVCIIDNDVVIDVLLDSSKSTNHDNQYLKFIYDGEWKAICQKDYYFIGDKIIKLGEGIYQIASPNIFYKIGLIVSKKVDNDFKLYQNKNLLISNHPSSTIHITSGPLINYYIYIKNRKIESNYQYILLNGSLYRGTLLENHDYLEIGDIKIIYNHNFLSIAANYLINLDLYQVEFKIPQEITKAKFYQLPNFKNFDFIYGIKLERYEINKQYDNNYSIIQSILMSLGMLVLSLINLMKNDSNSNIEVISAILMPSLMLVIAVIFPLLQRRSKQRQLIKNNQLIKVYNQSKLEQVKVDYLKDLNDFVSYNTSYDFNYAVIEKLIKNANVFRNNIKTDGFLKLNLGKYEFLPTITINTNDKDDTLLKEIERFKNTLVKTIKINYILDLNSYHKIVFVGNKDKIIDYFKIILLQIVITHNYNDLKIALVLDTNMYHNEYLNIKHLHNDKRLILYQNDNLDDLYKIKESLIIMSFVEIDLINDNQYLMYFNYQDDYYQNYDLLLNLDDYCLYDFRMDEKIKIEYLNFNCNFLKTIDDLNQFTLGKSNDEYSYTLHDFYNLKTAYHKHNKGLWTCFSYDNKGIKKYYDLSEKGIGPHLLISGTTGSGKTELALSLILSLCLNYRADEVSLVLIDYKGTGLKETLSYGGEMLRHISLCLTNLDQFEFNRALRAFKIELERRELLFEKMAKLSGTSIMNIDDYNAQDYKCFNLERLTHYFIIIDEFAQLKSDKPHFMQEIISISRIGRSLGFHLILITQKVTTVVDDEIKANIATNICLKVNSVSDSREMLNSDVAYKICRPGEYYLHYANNLDHGYSLYARAYDDPKNLENVKIIDYSLKTTKSIDYISENKNRQSSKYINLINEYHHQNHIDARTIFLPKLKDCDFNYLLHKYNYELKDNEFLIGEYDDYNHMNQGLLIHNFNENKQILTYFRNNENKYKYLYNLISSFNQNDCHILLLCSDMDRYNIFKQRVEIIDANNKPDLHYLLRKLLNEKEKILVVVDDYNIFKQDEESLELFFKLVLNTHQQNLMMQIFSLYGQNIPYKLNSLFKMYLLDGPSKDEMIFTYGSYNDVSSDMVFMHKNKYLVGFRLSLNDKNEWQSYKNNYLFKIPERIEFETFGYEVLLGYRVDLRIKYYLDITKRILITAYYQDILNVYKQYFNYSNIVFKSYHQIDHNDYYDLIVWIGPNIHNQYLFRTKMKKDLNINEAYVFDKEDGFVVKVVNDASNNQNC